MSVPIIAPLTLQAGWHLAPPLTSHYLSPFGLQSAPIRAPGTEPAILEVLRLIRDYDADVSHATETYVRLANPGHQVAVHDLNGQPHPAGEAYLNDLAERIWQAGGGGADTLVDVLHLAQWSYGGVGIEVEVTPDLHDVVDFHPFGPFDIDFAYVPDSLTGSPRLTMFPAVVPLGEQALSLNPLQTFYLPLDPDLQNPYGRAPLLPAVAAVVELVQFLHILVTAMKVHGTGKTDVSIDVEKAVAGMPRDYLNPGADNQARVTAYLESIRKQVASEIERLGPADTHVHYNNVAIASTFPSGVGAGALQLVDQLARRLQTGLKTPSVIMGSTEGPATMGTVQWQVYVRRLRAANRRSKRLLEKGYNLALRLRGFAAVATITFNAIRESDRALDANTAAVEANTARVRYRLGLIDHTELSNDQVEHDPLGPVPPTEATEFELQQTVAGVTLAPLPVETVPPIPPAPSGSDAGLTAEEGAALDNMGNSPTAAANNPGSNLGAGGTRSEDAHTGHLVLPALPDSAIAVLGHSILSDVRRGLAALNADLLLDLLEAEAADPRDVPPASAP